MEDPSTSSLFQDFPKPTPTEWMELATHDLKGADFDRKLIWKLESGIKISPFYTQDGLAVLHAPEDVQNLALPKGETVLAAREWESREYIEVTNPKTANAEALEALNSGATGLLFDLTQVGLVDFCILLKDVKPEYCHISFNTGNSAFAIIRHYRQYLENTGVPLDKVVGQLGFDPISRWMRCGEMMDSCYHQMYDVVQAVDDMPQFRPFSVSTNTTKNAGANISQEVGTLLATLVAYIDKLTHLGLSAKDCLSRVAIHVAISGSFFPEIAKLRAVRYLVARIAEIYEVHDYNASKTFISSQCALWNKTVFDPKVNILRNTTEGMAAVLGGSDSVMILPHDHIFRQSNAFSRRIARNINNLMRDESHLDKVVDPAAGSYFLESLTQEIMSNSWKFFQDIEREGGIKEAFKAGWLQDAILGSQENTLKEVQHRVRTQVGVNAYPNAMEKIDPESLSFKKEDVAEESHLRLLGNFRASEAYERIRLDTERQVKRHGNNIRPKVHLVLVGDPVMRRARASFSRGFFGLAGFSVLPDTTYESWNEAALDASKSEAHIVVLCGSDANYEEFAEGFGSLFSKKSEKVLVLAGTPSEHMESLNKAGFEFFISAKCNAVEMLHSFQKRLNLTQG